MSEHVDPYELQLELSAAGVIHFRAHEILYLGGSHGNGRMRNELPPASMIHALVGVAQEAEKLRTACGFPLRVVSGYRCPVYNRRVGGASRSMHLQGRALDLKPVDPGKISELKAAAVRLHGNHQLRGGLGLYPSFVHVDTGSHRRW